MKKSFMLPALAALVLFSACNDDSRNSYIITGSQESGKTLIGFDGVTYTPLLGAELIPTIPDGLSRTRMMMEFYLPEGRENQNAITGENMMDIELLRYTQLPTKSYAHEGSTETDDPIFLPTSEMDQYYPLSSSPGITSNGNYLDMYFAFKGYVNSSNEVIEGDPVLEIDPDIVPGTKNDTINMRLLFNLNPKGVTPQENARQNYVDQMSFDLQHVPADFGFPELNNSQPITYIIKMAYKSYKDIYSPKDDETVIRYVTCEWTPLTPYWTEEE